jgi:hypothetical protein
MSAAPCAPSAQVAVDVSMRVVLLFWAAQMAAVLVRFVRMYFLTLCGICICSFAEHAFLFWLVAPGFVHWWLTVICVPLLILCMLLVQGWAFLFTTCQMSVHSDSNGLWALLIYL